MVVGKVTNHMTDLMWRPHWSMTQSLGPSGGRHQTLDILLPSLTSSWPEPMHTPRDSNNNHEEGIQDVSDKVVKKQAQMDHMEDAPELAVGDNENVTNMNKTEDSEDDACMEVHSDEELEKDPMWLATHRYLQCLSRVGSRLGLWPSRRSA